MPEKSICKLHFRLFHFFEVKQSLDPQSSGWTQGLTVNRRMNPLEQGLKVVLKGFQIPECQTLSYFPGEGKGYPLQYSGLENSMDCTVHGAAKNRTQLSDFFISLR